MISNPNLNPEYIDVVVLCGGLGTRLKKVVSDRPKVMAEVNNKPFLEILIDYIAVFGFRRFVMCVGYMKEKIREHFERRKDVEILFSAEEELLGTAGAIKNAEKFIRSNPFLVVNGDSFCRINVKGFLDFHITKKAYASIALVLPEKDADYGVVAIGDDQRILSFNEKREPDTGGFINAGMYFFNRDILKLIPENITYSLEYNLFPHIIDKGIYGYVTGEKLIDIGTPERYRKAEEILNKKI